MPQTIIVSNRLPVSVRRNKGKLEYYPSSGGLATGLSSFTKEKSNVWIGWPGIAAEDLSEDEKQDVTERLATQNCYPVFLTRRQIEDYYNGYSNSVLWPYLHDLEYYRDVKDKTWRAYREVNQLFADVTVMLAHDRCRIWVHDYQLMLVPRMLRKQRPDADIGFFMHIPFPMADKAVQLSTHRSLIKGLLGSNLVGFHTHGYAQHFLESCQIAGLGAVIADRVITSTLETEVTAFPLGIDYLKYARAGSSTKVKHELAKLHKRYGRKKVILTVDRLDPTKGFVERLNAYRDFLERYPKWRGKVVMSMLAVPSRTDIPVYQQLRDQVESMVDTINNRFGKGGWKPIDYHYRSVSFEKLSALYQVAHVAFVSPIKDGMNLVAKEYIASKSGKSGVLILSRTAGAATELKEALLVNPDRTLELSNALAQALMMPAPELQLRLKRMQKHLSAHTVQTWTKDFMHSLSRSSTHTVSITLPLYGARIQKLLSDYTAAKRRLLLLDYDGVLAPIRSVPSKAAPSSSLLQLLEKLSKQKHTDVAVISGRSQENLEAWLGNAPVALAAEHGAAIKSAPGQKWQHLVQENNTWKAALKPTLEKYAKEAPGSFVEEKQHALVWHYRKSTPYMAQKYNAIIRRNLGPIVKKMGLQLNNGHKILEIKSSQVNKSVATKFFMIETYDFVLAIGDDYTDESMYKALPRRGYSIRVGRGVTAAKWRLSSQEKAIALLERLAHSGT
ncbi:MAG: bifunctional alpha,alpha-trehalose-phosphate synthase (UDP-forming)/trehalose-phosphatase [Candidatus Saccharibacteria bacterium]|nr:bifunctional alpha,alpha-trehalose-phosphate synthase (UDP-forming)/trehalose-phosphatase [Candidatus Saccharibacteria bacterium]